MSDLNASLFNFQSSQSIAFKFFSESVKEIERQINSTAGLNFFTTEQIDFIVLICDQFQKLVKLRSKSKLIENLLGYNFPEFFKPSEESNVPALSEACSRSIEPIERGNANKFSFVCDVCEEDVPILNDDLSYSTQSHLSSPYHLEVVSVLRKIKESANSVAGSSSIRTDQQTGAAKASPVPKIVPNGTKVASRAIVSNSKSTSKQSAAVSTISKEEESFQRHAWIQSQRQSQFLLWRRSQYYCCLCDAFLPTQHNFDAHVRSFVHRGNVATNLKSANGSGRASSVGICDDDKPSKSQVATSTRSASSDNQSHRSRGGTPTQSVSDNDSSQIIVIDNGVRVCSLCYVRMPSDANFASHMNSVSHRAKFEIFKKTYNTLNKALNNVTNSRPSSSTSAASVKSNPAQNGAPIKDKFLITRDGTQYCGLCNVKVPGKAQQDSHFNGSVHKEQLKTVAKKPANKSFTDFIITKDEKRYCILCNINLPGESQLTGHKYGKLHKQKLQEYEEKYLS